jgi:hypothetical protein
MKITNATFTTSKFTVTFKMEFGTWTHVTITTYDKQQSITAHIRNTTVDDLRDKVIDLTMRMNGTSDDTYETTKLVSRYWNNETGE